MLTLWILGASVAFGIAWGVLSSMPASAGSDWVSHKARVRGLRSRTAVGDDAWRPIVARLAERSEAQVFRLLDELALNLGCERGHLRPDDRVLADYRLRDNILGKPRFDQLNEWLDFDFQWTVGIGDASMVDLCDRVDRSTTLAELLQMAAEFRAREVAAGSITTT